MSSQPYGLEWFKPENLYDYAAVVIVVVSIGLTNKIHPFERPFDPNDPDLSHPHWKTDIVPMATAFAVTVGVPIAVVTIFAAIKAAYGASAVAGRGHKWALATFLVTVHDFCLPFVLTIELTSLFTDVVKNWAGRLRPDFLDRCRWSAETHACTGDPALILDGRRSFFSGHSSFSFAGFTFLALYLSDALGIFAHQTKPRGLAFRLTLIIMLFLIPSYIAISRTQQYIHHPTDVMTGSLFGVFMAVVGYRAHFKARLPSHQQQPDLADVEGGRPSEDSFNFDDRLRLVS
ncbi:phosphatidic acid phosphatase type 2/haloperoxidase [Polychytrium aggregatum]|uniref:phosphatidic acid phosphatase type 2/haloperoxidase n=1 Tax=Polychytrium aggregatum TaxID=110093 RepID=UPI0022FF249E|nr:phosphatidic acid phosphatase type 2/haloperoxidase [Polychytrium aggregatum]KAI9199239.1 phosphatidic acid phosphatase type 2/haloperoxidase [Polychytrium aggregatum]